MDITPLQSGGQGRAVEMLLLMSTTEVLYEAAFFDETIDWPELKSSCSCEIINHSQLKTVMKPVWAKITMIKIRMVLHDTCRL